MPSSTGTAAGVKPPIPADIPEFFLRARVAGGLLIYRAAALGMSKLHFVDAKNGIDVWVPYTHLAPLSDAGKEALWEESKALRDIKASSDSQPASGASFSPLPTAAANPRSVVAWRSALEDYLYQNVTVTLFSCPALNRVSRPGEAEGDFRAHVAQAMRERRDAELEKLRDRYAPKFQALQDRLRRAQERAEREQSQYAQQKMQTVISIGATILGAFLGRKAVSSSSVGHATTAMRGASRTMREKEDITRADENVAAVQERQSALQQEFDTESADLQGRLATDCVPVDTVTVRPRKSDITVGAVGIVWTPWRVGADGVAEPAC
jgi:hypothetical protein